MKTQFKLPNLGEGIEHGDVVRITVETGQTIKPQQTVLELETDKALVEVPSSVAGEVLEIHVSEGDRLAVGDVILTVEEQETAETPESAPADKEESDANGEERDSGKETHEDTKATDEGGKAKAEEDPGDEHTDADKSGDLGRKYASSSSDEDSSASRKSREFHGGAEFDPDEVVPAGPATRRFARELGVELQQVKGSGRSGRITKDDVREYVQHVMESGAPGGTQEPALELPDFTQWGNVRREPLSRIRRKIAEHLAPSWRAIPLVTQYEYIDITELESERREHKEQLAAEGVKLTLMPYLIRAVAAVLNTYPRFNASLDAGQGEVVYKDYINMGIAVDTPDGLLVPVIKHVERASLREIATALEELGARAREGKPKPEDLVGATFSISNQGAIGGAEFTPLINHPQAAILGAAQARVEPRYVDGELLPRQIMPVALSYDHRLNDGADAARFVTRLKALLESPALLLAYS